MIARHYLVYETSIRWFGFLWVRDETSEVTAPNDYGGWRADSDA